MSRFVCGGWTPDGPCDTVLAPSGFSSHEHARRPSPLSPDRFRAARVNLTRRARFDDAAWGAPARYGCWELDRVLSCSRTAKRAGASAWGRRGGGPPIAARFTSPTPLTSGCLPWWQPRARRAQLAALEAEAARARPWPAPRPRSRAEVDALLADRDAVQAPAPADEAADARTALERALASARAAPWPTDTDREPAAAVECRSRWYSHSGLGPRSDAGAVRHAAATLFPHAAPPRECDEPASNEGELAAWLAGQGEEAQQALTLLGVHTLTLFRAVHLRAHRPSEIPAAVADAARAGVEQGTLRVDDPGERFLRVAGTAVASPIVSTIDGWSTSRDHANHWQDPGSHLNILMVADVNAWAVLSWSTLGLGDRLLGGDQEVIVLGGRGLVRWELDGAIPAALAVQHS